MRVYSELMIAKTRDTDLENLQRIQSIRAVKPPGNRTPRQHELAESGRSDGAVLGLDFPTPRNRKVSGKPR